jgi:hypothetical protein
MMEERPKNKKRGPKGGIKHQPGRGHDRKSLPAKKAKFRRKAERTRATLREKAQRQWEQWDALSDEKKRILHDFRPKLPRPETP